MRQAHLKSHYTLNALSTRIDKDGLRYEENFIGLLLFNFYVAIL